MQKSLVNSLALGMLLAYSGCAKTKTATTANSPQVNAQARLLSLNAAIDSLEALPEAPAAQLDSLRKLRALEQNNLELMGKAQGTKPAEDPQELYKANAAKAQEDRSLGRKPEFLIP